jgi:hypothetical protein
MYIDVSYNQFELTATSVLIEHKERGIMCQRNIMHYSHKLCTTFIFSIMICHAAEQLDDRAQSSCTLDSGQFKNLVGFLSCCESGLNFLQYHTADTATEPNYVMYYGLLPALCIAGTGCFFKYLGRQPQQTEPLMPQLPQHTHAQTQIAQNYRDAGKLCDGLSCGVATSFLSMVTPHGKMVNLIGGIVSCGIPVYVWLKNSKECLKRYIPCLRRNAPPYEYNLQNEQ